MDSTNWDKLKEAYKSAEDFLADMPIGKAIANVISNPTPQEIGAQVANLGSDISKSLSKATENPVESALNFSPMGIVRAIKAPHDISSVSGDLYSVNKGSFMKGGPYGSYYTGGRGEGIRVSNHGKPGEIYKKIDDVTSYRTDAGYIDFVIKEKTVKKRLQRFEDIWKSKGKEIWQEAGGEDFMPSNIKADDFLEGD